MICGAYGHGWNVGAETVFHNDQTICPFSNPEDRWDWIQAWRDGAVWYLYSSNEITVH